MSRNLQAILAGYSQRALGPAPLPSVLPERKTLSRNIDINQAREILLRALETKIVPFLWGPPGIGKSSLVKQICLEKGWDIIDLRLSLLNPVDLRGLPVINKRDRLAHWYHPSFLPNGQHKKPGILFLDEINLAPPSVQSAAYQLILDKKVGEYNFPPHWKIVAAGNRETDRANVYRIPAPLANRFFHINVSPDLRAWIAWAKEKNEDGKQNVRDEIIGFLTLRPPLLLKMPSETDRAFPTPRSWHFASQLLDAYGYKKGLPVTEDLKQTLYGTVGESVAKEFITAYMEKDDIRNLSAKIEIFKHSGEIDLPSLKNEAVRNTITTAICNAYREGEIDAGLWEAFKKKLVAEEREAIKKLEEEGIL